VELQNTFYTLGNLKWNKNFNIFICKMFECSKTSLKRWIDKYKLQKSITRNKRISISYKVTKKQVKYAIKKIKENEQITLDELTKIIKKKFKNFNITPDS